MSNRWQAIPQRRVLRSISVIPCALALFGAGAYAMSEHANDVPGGRGLPRPVLTSSIAVKGGRSSVRLRFTDRDTDAGFQCSLDKAPPTPCSSPELYRGGIGLGEHRFRVRAVEISELHASPFASYTWTVASYTWIGRALSAPRIMEHPPGATSSTSATFKLSDRQLPLRFQCRLDSAAWRLCRRGVTYRGLGVGGHRFLARAIDPPARPSSPAQFRWRVMPAGAPVSIASGEVPGTLYPGGAPLPIPITLTNPGDAPIYVSNITVSVVASPPGCPAAGNLILWQSTASPAHQVEIAAQGSVALPAQGVSLPQMALRDLPVNQDACRNGTFGLAITGSASAQP